MVNMPAVVRAAAARVGVAMNIQAMVDAIAPRLERQIKLDRGRRVRDTAVLKRLEWLKRYRPSAWEAEINR